MRKLRLRRVTSGIAEQAHSPRQGSGDQALEADRGEYLGYVRLVGRRRTDAILPDQILSVPTEYIKKPLLRTEP